MVAGLMESAETIRRSDGGMDPFKSSPVHPTYVWPAPVSHCGRACRAFSICMIEEGKYPGLLDRSISDYDILRVRVELA